MSSFYRCRNCGTKFKGVNLRYCAFCGSELEIVGMIIGGESLQEDIEKGWRLIGQAIAEMSVLDSRSSFTEEEKEEVIL